MRPIDGDILLQHKRKMSGADWGGEYWDEAVLVSDIVATPTIEIKPVQHGHNISECNPVDEFICSNCGLIMRDFSQIRIDEDGEYEYCCEFEFLYCPKCGYRITEEGENANTCNM